MSGLYQRYMNMDGGGEKYTVDSIIEHKGRGVETLSNGAIAGYVQTADGPRWRIVQGASPQYMATIAKKRGVRSLLHRNKLRGLLTDTTTKKTKTESY